MQVCRKLGDKITKVFLALLGNFFKVHNEAGEPVLREVLHRLLRKVPARRAVFQHGRHIVRRPVCPIGIV